MQQESGESGSGDQQHIRQLGGELQRDVPEAVGEGLEAGADSRSYCEPEGL